MVLINLKLLDGTQVYVEVETMLGFAVYDAVAAALKVPSTYFRIVKPGRETVPRTAESVDIDDVEKASIIGYPEHIADFRNAVNKLKTNRASQFAHAGGRSPKLRRKSAKRRSVRRRKSSKSPR